MRARLWAAVAVAAALAAADASHRIVRVLAVAPRTPVSVQITVGNVEVRGWDRSQVEVQVTRRADDGVPIGRVTPEVEQDAGGVRVRAVQADEGRDPRIRTDVVLRVPAATEVRELAVFEGRVDVAGVRGPCTVRVERGDITVREAAGPLRLETVIGDIRVERGTIVPDAPVRLRTFNGAIALELTAMPADARILALSMGGTIVSDIPLAVKEAWGPRFGETTLGRGAPVVSLDAVNGDISIRVRK